MVTVRKSPGKLQFILTSAGLVAGLLCMTACQKEVPAALNTVDSGDEKIAAARIAEGDQLYEAREDMARARVAVAALRQAVTADYGSYEAAWKLSRACFYVGDHTDNGTESDEMFQAGIEAGKVAVKLQPDKPEGHFWLGANYGGEASRSTLASLASVNDIRTEMETVIKIDEKFQGGSAYLGLGRLYLQAPTILAGSTAKAIENLKTGLAISPSNALMKYYLAEAYESDNRDGEARKLLDEVLKSTPDPKFVAEHKDALAKASKLLQRLSNK